MIFYYIYMTICLFFINANYGIPGLLSLCLANSLAYARHEILHIVIAKILKCNFNSLWSNIRAVYGTSRSLPLSIIQTITNLTLGRVQTCPTYILPMNFENNISVWLRFLLIKLFPSLIDIIFLLIGMLTLNNTTLVQTFIFDYITPHKIPTDIIILLAGLMIVSSARLLPNLLPFKSLDGHILFNSTKKVLEGESRGLGSEQEVIFATAYCFSYGLSLTYVISFF